MVSACTCYRLQGDGRYCSIAGSVLLQDGSELDLCQVSTVPYDCWSWIGAVTGWVGDGSLLFHMMGRFCYRMGHEGKEGFTKLC